MHMNLSEGQHGPEIYPANSAAIWSGLLGLKGILDF